MLYGTKCTATFATLSVFLFFYYKTMIMYIFFLKIVLPSIFLFLYLLVQVRPFLPDLCCSSLTSNSVCENACPNTTLSKICPANLIKNFSLTFLRIQLLGSLLQIHWSICISVEDAQFKFTASIFHGKKSLNHREECGRNIYF